MGEAGGKVTATNKRPQGKNMGPRLRGGEY